MILTVMILVGVIFLICSGLCSVIELGLSSSNDILGGLNTFFLVSGGIFVMIPLIILIVSVIIELITK
jgi:hypothetical protein